MITGIDFEYEYMIHARSTPTVRVYSDEENVQYNEKRASVQLYGHFPLERKFAVFNIGHRNLSIKI